MKSSDDCRAYAAEAFALSQAMLDFSQASNFQRNFLLQPCGDPCKPFFCPYFFPGSSVSMLLYVAVLQDL